MATGLDTHLLPFESRPERLQGFGAFALADFDHRPYLQVQDDDQIAVSLADADLIDGDLLEIVQLGTGKAPWQISLFGLCT